LSDPTGKQSHRNEGGRNAHGTGPAQCAGYEGCAEFAERGGGAVAIIVGAILIIIPDPGFGDVAGLIMIARAGQVIRISRSANRARTAIFRGVQRNTRGLKNQLDSDTLRGAQRELRKEVTGVSQRTGRPYNHIKKVRNAKRGLENQREDLVKLRKQELTDGQRRLVDKQLQEIDDLIRLAEEALAPI